MFENVFNPQCSETNENSLYRFLRYFVFEIWSIFNHINTPYKLFLNRPKICAMFWNVFSNFFVRLLVFELWSILYSTSVVNWGSPSRNEGFRGVEPPEHNFFFWIRLSPECTTKVKCKIYHNSKTKNPNKKTRRNSKIRFRTLRTFWDDKKNQFLVYIEMIVNRPYLKDRKIDFSLISEHCAKFWQENKNGSF